MENFSNNQVRNDRASHKKFKDEVFKKCLSISVNKL